MLGLIHENEAVVRKLAPASAAVLELASEHLKILDPEVGEQELIKAVAAEVAKLRALSRSV